MFFLGRFSAPVSVCLCGSGGELLLASCSQDCLIRVWRLCAKSGTDARAEDEDHGVIRMKEDVFEVEEKGEKRRGLLINQIKGQAFFFML